MFYDTTMAAECWFLPTDDSTRIGPWTGPLKMIQGRSSASLVSYKNKVKYYILNKADLFKKSFNMRVVIHGCNLRKYNYAFLFYNNSIIERYIFLEDLFQMKQLILLKYLMVPRGFWRP